jgi:thiamine-phosphate pyrophosphorylase
VLPVRLPPLYAILDVDVCAAGGRDVVETAELFLEGGARLVQLRAKSLASGAFLDLAREVVSRGRRHGALVIVNDRADVAVMAEAAGVHVGQEDLPAAAARRLVGPSAIVGASTHSVAQVESALEEPIDYLAVGPVFATGTKDTGYEPVGLDMVRRAADLARHRGVPVVAIGGITRATAPAVLDAGASSVAVISGLMREDVVASVRAFAGLAPGADI